MPNHEETVLLEKKYYETMDNKTEIINKKLKNISKTKEVKLLNEESENKTQTEHVVLVK